MSTLVRITRDNHADLWPLVVTRIRAFSLRYGAKPDGLINSLWTLFATNSPLYNHMIDDMDIDAGVVLAGTPVEVVGQQIFEEILAVASGKKTKSEINDVGEEEFAPWAIGPTL